MTDAWGNLISEVDSGDIATAYGAYQGYKRAEPFLDAANKAFTGWQAKPVVEMGMRAGQRAIAGAATRAAGTGLAEAATSTLAKTAVSTGVKAAAIGGAEAAVAGGAARAGLLAAGIGTGPIGWAATVASIAAPFVLPHIPVVGEAVNKIPLIGPMLSPKEEEKKPKALDAPITGYRTPASPHLQTPDQYSASNRADYQAGRGFRRQW